MKKTVGLFLLIMGLSFAFSNAHAQKSTSLNDLWLRADALINYSQQPRSALQLLDTITEMARKQGQNDELIRASVYRLALQRKLTDEEPGYYIPYVDSLIATAANPAETSLLTLLKARLFIAIYQQDISKIRGRTAIQGGLPDESKVAFWTAADFQYTIHALYTKALAPKALLQKTPNIQYSAIIESGNTPGLRPTLYDLILQDAIDYYNSGVVAAIQVESPFRLTDSKSLSEAAEFVHYPFEAPSANDSLNNQWLLLGYYQQLLAFRLSEAGNGKAAEQHSVTSALADVDLQRLQWAYNELRGQSSDHYLKPYRSALESAISKYKGTDEALYGTFLLANTYAEAAGKFNVQSDTAHKNDYKTALLLIDQQKDALDKAKSKAAASKDLKETKDTSLLPPGAAALINLKTRILRPDFNLQMASYNLPGEPMLALVQFSNIDKLYFRVLRIPVALDQPNFTDSLWQELTHKSPIQSFSQALPATGDHQSHAVEIKIPALQRGAYLLLASTDPDFPMDRTLGAASINVTNLAYLSHSEDLFFVDRKNGQPLMGVDVQFFDRTWQDRHYKYSINHSLQTDETGRITQKGKSSSNQPMLAVYNGDSLSSNIYIYHRYEPDNKENKEGLKEMSFYLDRSIYRPGQEVLFKGIATVMYEDERGRKLLTDNKTYKVYLLDANNQPLDSLSLKLNSFGALSGTFRLPIGQMAGNYSLKAQSMNKRQFFKVEEYKRPTYFVSIDTLKDAVSLGDSVTIHGQAMAYSGYPITDAKVEIRVTRNVYFPYSWYRYLPDASPISVAHGTVETDAKGNFDFTFMAAKGDNSWSRFMPNYNFVIEATSTDLNGETRSAGSHVILGSQPFNLSVNIPDNASSDQLDTLYLTSRTAAGEFTQQQVSLKITQVEAPRRLLRNRLWDVPDLSVIDSAEFVRDFPHDPYMDQLDKDHWQRGRVVYRADITTNPAGKIGLGQKIGPGWYEVLAEAPGVDGQTIRDRKYVYLYNAKDPLVAPSYHWFDQKNKQVLAGEMSGFTLAGSQQNQYVIYSTTKEANGRQKLKYKHVVMQGKPVQLPLRLTEKDIHGGQLDYAYVRDNRTYTGSITVHLKDTTTLPEIVYESFRDKTEPGTKEHWTLHINKGTERLKDMELLSAMYDASLDQFTPHRWSLLTKKSPGGLYTAYWQNSGVFGLERARMHPVYPGLYTEAKTYDKFIYDELFRRNRPGRNIMLRGGVVHAALSGKVAGLADQSPAPALNDVVVVGYGMEKKELLTASVKIVNENNDSKDQAAMAAQQPVRSDFRETAFFFPAIHSDAEGNYTVDFQMPDALTSWKWMNMAYDKDLQMVTGVKKIVTQKTLMVRPNMPRFVRNGDQLSLSAQIVNLSEADLTSAVSLEIQDPATGKALDWFTKEANTPKEVTVGANSAATVHYDISVPADFTGPVSVTLRANGGQYSDAEKNMLPVLTNKMEVTETLPIYLKGNGEKTFTMDKLIALSGVPGDNKDGTKEKESKKLVLELTTNPIWNVVMALPDVQIGDKPSGMGIMHKLYADAMGAYVINKYPEIARVIHTWAAETASGENKDALLSALEKNPDLKSILLKQTPWVLDANNETAQHKALVRFFDKAALDSAQRSLVGRLMNLQQSDGGFSWFSGGQTDILSTQNVLGGVHQLLRGKLKGPSLEIPLSKIAADAGQYLSSYYTMNYEGWLNRQNEVSASLRSAKATGNRSDKKPDTLYPIGAMEIQYLYVLSMNPEATGSLNEMQRFFLKQETASWQQRSVYLQLMIAATQYRMGDRDFAIHTVLKSLLDRTVRSEVLGMYWKQEARYYSWYENNLQAQALAISLLTEIGNDAGYPEWKNDLAELERYLISQKQVNHWPATQTTVDACVAMIDAAPENLVSQRQTEVMLGNQTLDLKKQEGTGYMRYEVSGNEINASMGKVTVRVKGAPEGGNTAIPVYGALYWQYISPIMAVEAAGKTPGISLGKSLYREVNTSSGKQLVPVKATDMLHVGDKLVSRLTIQLDRDMDYVHLREMRAAGVQPDQTLSGYQYKDGLSYYQTTGDLTTDLFFDHIAKGAYVIEYPVHVSHAGRFAAGTATMESFYAPEFATHTEGIAIQAEADHE